jgi:glycosyltransferase involved in cell wall biosynthesis
VNILQVSRDSIGVTSESNGLEYYIFNLSNNLVKIGHKVTIVGRRQEQKEKLSVPLQAFQQVHLGTWRIPNRFVAKMPAFIAILCREFNQASFSLRAVIYIRSVINDYDIIAIHLPLTGSIIAILLRGHRQKIVYTSHSNYWGLSVFRLKRSDKLALGLESWLMKRVGKVIAWSEELKTQYISYSKVKDNHVFVVPGGIDFTQFDQNADIARVKQKWIPDNRFNILFVGRLSRIKGIDYLLKAMNTLVNRWGYRNVVLFIVGPRSLASTGHDKPVDMQSLNNYINNSGIAQNVVFTGEIPKSQLAQYYLNCDIFVLPSLAELFPAVVLEAMASGKPVIATKVGAISIQVKDGWNGFLVTPANDNMLAEKIRILLDDPVKRSLMGINSKIYAAEYFSWCKVAEKISSVYEKKGL